MPANVSISAPPPESRLPNYQPMVLCVLAFASGILLDRFFEISIAFSAGVLVTSLITWLAIRFCSYRSGIAKNSRSRMLIAASMILCVGWVALGAFWHHGRWHWFGTDEIGRYAELVAKPCALEAIVLTEPRMIAPSEATGAMDYGDESVRTKLLLKAQRIRNGGSWQRASGKLDLIIHAPTRHVRSGDAIRVYGRLVGCSPPSNPGQFDFQAFYRAASKLAFLHAYHRESVVVVSPQSAGRFQPLSALRREFNDLTWKYVNGDEAAFASAIMLGNREQLSPDRRQLFLETGTIHLLAISGLHVGILAGSFFLLFRIGLVSRRNCLLATMVFVVFYAWLVEFRPPVSRAAILILLYCLGRIWGENNFSFNLLAIAGMIVLLINPMDLFGLGPQLSFLAVATLTFGKEWVFWPPPTDPIQRLIASTRPWQVRVLNWLGRQVRTAILVSGLIWLVAMPLVAYRFHLVAPVALVVNPLLLLPMAWALYGGLGVLVSGWLFPPAAEVCGEFCRFNLGCIESLICLAQSLPGSHLWTSGPTLAAVLVFYVGLFFTAVFPPTRLSLKWTAILGATWLVFAWLVPNQISDWHRRQDSGTMVCTFVDVGHGTSVLIELPNGKNVLYDAGSFGSADYGFRNIASLLWSQRIARLDTVIVSHADIDHFNSLPQLAERFAIGQLLVSEQMLNSPSAAVASLLSTCRDRGIPIDSINAGDRLIADCPVEIKVLSPPVFGTGGGDNSNSLVILVDFQGRRLLLPGDLESYGLDRLLQSEPMDCDIVMAPHHGSKNSFPHKFLQWATPEHVVISGGSQRIDRRMVQQFDGSGRAVYRTDTQGAIRFEWKRKFQRSFHWNVDHWEPIIEF
jgi:competence protein ComEC